MNLFLSALAFAAIPAFGNFVGGLLAELVPVSQRTLSLALHAAAGIVAAVVGIELMPAALAAEQPWIPVLAFVAGGSFFLLMDRMIERVQTRRGGKGGNTGAWAILFGVAVDLFSDGVMIGTGSTISFGLGLLLALGQMPADVPEGFATIATFRRQGMARRTRLLLSAAFAIPIFLGTTIGYWAVRSQPEIVKLSLLAFTAGILFTVVIEEIVPEAHEGDEADVATLFLVGGFALFALISGYLGE
jgi:ZIP family zinc transporter